MYELIDRCIYNGRTWDNESLANIAHMYQAKRIVYKRYQSIPMICAKLDKNENAFTRLVIKYCELKTRSGARRLAQKDTPYLVPTLSPKTFGFRLEAIARLYKKMVDRQATLQESRWPPLYEPAVVLRPVSRPIVGQAPPAQPRQPSQPRPPPPTQPTTSDQPPPDSQPPPPRTAPTPAHRAKIIGPAVGDSGSSFDVVLCSQRRDWRTAGLGRPEHTGALDDGQVAAKLAGRELVSESISCPACHRELGVQLPSGVTTVQCEPCGARPLHIVVRPPEVKPQKGRSQASHHGPPRNPLRTGRAPTVWNKYVQAEQPRVLAEAKAAGEPISSKEAMKQLGQSWPEVRDAMDADTEARAGTRRARRPPAARTERGGGTGAKRSQRASTPLPMRPQDEAPNSRDAHVRGRRAADAPKPVVCSQKGCPLAWKRVPPPAYLATVARCDECSAPLGKFSWQCATVSQSCDFDMCNDCYTSRMS